MTDRVEGASLRGSWLNRLITAVTLTARSCLGYAACHARLCL